MSGWWKKDNGSEEEPSENTETDTLGWFARQLREPDIITLPGEPVDAQPFLTSEQVAARLNVAHAEIWSACMTGRITCFRVGKEFRIPESEVERIFREGLP